MRWSVITGANGKVLPVFGALACAIGLLSGCITQPTRDTSSSAASEPVVKQQPVRPPCPQLSAREMERDAIELLDRGETARARELLDCAIAEHPGSSRARLLISQLDEDPVSTLGAKHYLYTVKPNETLSQIAQDRLDDSLKFVILARYNDIPVPANLVAGQQIKIPGIRPPEKPQPASTAEQAPSETAAPAQPPPAEATAPEQTASTSSSYEAALRLEKQGDLEGAYAGLAKLKAQGSDVADLENDLHRVRSALVAKLEDQAYSFELAGNIDKALATWRQVLEIDPNNIPAQLSIRRLTQ